MSDNQEKLQMFLQTTAQSDIPKALQMLECTNWDLDKAVTLHFSMMDTPDPPASSIYDMDGPSSVNFPSLTDFVTSSQELHNSNLGLEALQPNKPEMSNLKTLSSANKNMKTSVALSSASSAPLAANSRSVTNQDSGLGGINNQKPLSSKRNRSSANQTTSNHSFLNDTEKSGPSGKLSLQSSSSSSLETLPKSSKKTTRSSQNKEISTRPSKFEFLINITNKHNKKVFKKCYRLDTLIEKVRKDACDYFKIPIALASWNIPNEIIDTDKVQNLKDNTGGNETKLEIENLAASIEGTNDAMYNYNEIVEISSDADEEAMEISSDEEKEVAIDNAVQFLSSTEPGPRTRSQANSSNLPNFNHNLTANTRQGKGEGSGRGNNLSSSSSRSKNGEKDEKSTEKLPHKGLIPKDFDNIPLAVNTMTSSIRTRFKNLTIPDFIVGTMGDCLCHTVNIRGDTSPYSELGLLGSDIRKPSIIYVNNEDSISRNLFLSNTMFAEPILSLLAKTANWCWDTTMPDNKNRFKSFIDTYFNNGASARIQEELSDQFAGNSAFQRRVLQMQRHAMGFDQSAMFNGIAVSDYPIFLVVTMDEETRTKPIIKSVIKSSMGSEEAFRLIDECINEYNELLTKIKKEELERYERDQFRRQQNQEYEKTIQEDIQKQTDKIDQQQVARAVEQEQIDRQNKVASDKSKAEKLLQQIDNKVGKLQLNKVCNIKMKLPTGETKLKKFPASVGVKAIFSWARILDYPDCNISSTYPRINLNDIRDGITTTTSMGSQNSKDKSLNEIFGTSAQLFLTRETEESEEEEDTDSE